MPCPTRSSAPFYVRQTAPPSSREGPSSAFRCAPDGTATDLPATDSAPASPHRSGKLRVASPAHNGILPESCPRFPQTAVYHERGSWQTGSRGLSPSTCCAKAHHTSGSAPAVDHHAVSALLRCFHPHASIP